MTRRPKRPIDQDLAHLIASPSGAVFSPDRRHRYLLWRSWADLFTNAPQWMLVIGLNPSTADEQKNDPTITRCIGFAQACGYSGLLMGNLFGFRATLPEDMKAEPDPVGPENDAWLDRLHAHANITVAAWGTDGAHLNRGSAVAQRLGELHCFRETRGGFPAHPLYLPAVLRPTPYGIRQ